MDGADWRYFISQGDRSVGPLPPPAVMQMFQARQDKAKGKRGAGICLALSLHQLREKESYSGP